MKQIQPDLWETDAERPFPGLITHAYLLVRSGGNLLFYNTGHLHELDAMANRGGVAWQFLSHQDELGDSIRTIRERFNAKLGGHRNEEAAFRKICAPDVVFDRRETLLGEVEIIPTPGHTPGSTCFLVPSAEGKRYLFTGDTLYLGGEHNWRAGYIRGYSSREPLADSLGLLRDLEPDAVISSASPTGVGFTEMSPGEWPAHVDGALQRLREAA